MVEQKYKTIKKLQKKTHTQKTKRQKLLIPLKLSTLLVRPLTSGREKIAEKANNKIYLQHISKERRSQKWHASREHSLRSHNICQKLCKIFWIVQRGEAGEGNWSCNLVLSSTTKTLSPNCLPLLPIHLFTVSISEQIYWLLFHSSNG